MNTQDVIETISRATNDLFATLRSNDDTIKALERTVERLEARVTSLEESLKMERESHQATRSSMYDQIDSLKGDLKGALYARDEAVKEQVRLKDVILNVAAAVDAVVNPINPVAGNDTVAQSSTHTPVEAPKPYIVDDKGLPHHPETGKFVEVPKEEEKATGTDGPFSRRPYWEH